MLLNGSDSIEGRAAREDAGRQPNEAEGDER